MRVLVFGAGVVGTMTAYYLMRQGHEVEVVDRQPAAGLETSFANGGLIAVAQAEPWGAPGLPVKILRWIGKEDAPLVLRPRVIPEMWRWGLEFLRNCTHERAWKGTLVNLRLALYSAAALKEVRKETGITYDALTVGSLKVYGDAKDLEEAAKVSAAQAFYGLEHRVMDAKEVIELEPALRPAAGRIVGAIYYPQDESGDCCMFTQGIAGLCAERGVRFRYGTTVQAIEAKGGEVTAVVTDKGRLEADRYVLALASESPLVARPLGIRLPIYPVKGYSLTVPGAAWPGRPKIPVVDETRKFGLIPFGERLRISGSAEIIGYDTVIREKRMSAILSAAADIYPDFSRCRDPKTDKLWACLRPVTPDGPPILGASPLRNLFFNTGQGHLGWTFACGSGKLVADIVSGRPPEIDMTGLAFDRYH
jgi:D-amino-acid dehydrogenase